MNLKDQKAFQGENNKRLKDCKPTNCECSAAWQSPDEQYAVDQVTKPSEDKVVDAKDWVDNGSML